MLNEIILQGRLTDNPELKTTQSGTNVTQFNLAVERDYTKDGNKETDFIPVVAWGKTAEFICRYFTKGRMLIAKGSLQIRKYQNKDGENRRATEVIADKVWFAGDKAEANTQNGFSKGFNTANDTAEDFQVVDEINEDLPF